ncbi:MAG: sulfatase-like hydrolase/transferase [Bacteroidales bacterium]
MRKVSTLYGLGVCVLLTNANLQTAGQETQKKNFLFIMTDQQRYDALSISGNTILETPNIDRLARQGTNFTNAYTPCAVCCPARSSILTGHTIENTGMRTNEGAYYPDDESLMNMPTFDEILSENGYRCEYYGKWHSNSKHTEIYQNPVLYANNGASIFGGGGQSFMFRDYLESLGDIPSPGSGEFVDGMSRWPYVANPMDKYFGMSWEQLQDQGLKHSQPDQHGELLLDEEYTMTAFQAKQTLEAIERLKDTVFSITCSFHFPHSPILPAEPYSSMYSPDSLDAPVSISDDMLNSPYINANGRTKHTEYSDPEKIKLMIADYYGLVKEIDVWVGRILDKLDELGLTENTLVIFVSDHGEMLGAHGMREKNVFYEESAHIPLMIRFPNVVPEETTVNGYISLIDLFPTILDYLGIPEHASNGKSLRGLIEGTDTIHGEYVVTEWDYRGSTELNYMIVKDGWKLMLPYTKSSTVINAMYDLNTDPHEMNNLLGSNPDAAQYLEKAEDLRASLLEWLEKNNSEHYDGVAGRVLVDDGTAVYNNASFVSQSVPGYLDPGEVATVSVTMKNTRTSTWTREGLFKLGSQNPKENVIWGIQYVELDEGDSIKPNSQKTFTFEITAPAEAGKYNFQWQMLEEHVEWFGALTNNVVITVGDVPDFLDACDEKTDWKSSQPLILNTSDMQEGDGCIEFSGSSTDEFKKVFVPAYNSGLYTTNARLQFWYYVSDPNLLESGNQVELGSGGKPDVNEYNWNLDVDSLVAGWNFITLDVADAGMTSGDVNLNAINWFRLYRKKTGAVITRIDAIELVDNGNGIPGNVALTNSIGLTVKVYPNPLNREVLYVDLAGFREIGEVNIRMVNLRGQTVYRQESLTSNHLEINTSDLMNEPVLFLSVESGQQVEWTKIIVTR